MFGNPFDSDVAARLYGDGRPDYSEFVTEMIRHLAGINGRIPFALDIASGTGISTMALAALAETVAGVEQSEAMLSRARPASNVEYRIGSAENLPVEDASCDLIAVGSALHRLDRDGFLAESARVAKPGAWLVVHDHWFVGRMEGNDDFGRWFRDSYLNAHPSPPRDRSWRPPDDLGMWKHRGWRHYEHPVRLTVEQLAAYLLSQSNLLTAIERGEQSETELRTWLLRATAPLLGGDSAGVFSFGGHVACHRLLQ